MVTKAININGAEIAVNDNYRKIVTAYGLSSDEKGIEGYKNADRFMEMDTGKVFIFDEANKVWCEI